MSGLIALEFKHAILRVVAKIDSILKVKTIILIAILAISKKFIILSVDKYLHLQLLRYRHQYCH